MISEALKRMERAQQANSTSLRLDRLGLKQIPLELERFRNLRYLDLSGNHLSEVPEFLWSLERLVQLDLGHNRLKRIDNKIERLIQLRVLDLSENKLECLPDEFGSALRELYACHNQISEIPLGLLRQTNLEVLDLSLNKIARMSILTNCWTDLVELDLSNNELNQVPEGIERLQSLRTLNLACNKLSSIDELQALEWLEELYLERNRLTGIPQPIAQLPALRILSIAQNPLTELPNHKSIVLKQEAEKALKKHLQGRANTHEHNLTVSKQPLGATLSIGGSKNIGRVIDLYYKNPQFPLSIKFPSGKHLDLMECTRKTAMQNVVNYRTLDKTQPATIGWSDAVSQDGKYQLIDFNSEAVGRVPGAKIINIDTGETISQNSIKDRHSSERRHVQMDLFDVTDENSRIMVKERVWANRSYELELYISSKFRGTLIFGSPVPDEELPSGDNDLSVHFVPLVRDESGNFPSSQHKILGLPEIGDSEVRTFNFVIPTLIETYRVRLIISYQNRVLQTMILSAPVGDSVGKFLLEPENVVDPSFEKLPERRLFDVAIIVNDSPIGVPGLITLKGELANFYELPKLEEYADIMRKNIYDKSAYPGVSKSYDSAGLRELIFILSVMGKNLWDELPQTIRELVTDETKRMQIVDVTSGVYFPAEFIYCGRSPKNGDKFCPNSAKVLQSPFSENSCVEMPHAKCEYWDNPNFICPLRMWGFRFVIERQPANGAQQLRNLLSDTTTNEQNAGKDIFDQVVISVSEKVYKANPMAAKELKSKLIKVAKNVDIVNNWTELKEIVSKKSPSFLILLPHSGIDEKFYKLTTTPETKGVEIQTLELGGEILRRDLIEREYIQGSDGGRPVVLLLGCDTNTAKIPFLNFIKRFEDCGAAMVMGTITPIEAKRTVDFVKGFISAYSMAKESSPTFGELLLEIRRQMLAAGDGYALSLLAYGDTDQLTK